MKKRILFDLPVLSKAIVAGIFLALALCLQTAVAVGPATWYVGNSYDDTACVSTHLCQFIQSAVNAASNGDTVTITPGTYTEQVDIGKDLSLIGAVGGGSIIKSPSTLATKFNTSGSTPNKPVVHVHDATVNLAYLTVDGDGKGNGNYRIEGIAFHNAGGTVDHVTITRIRETPASGTQHGVGLYVLNEDAAPRTLTATNNSVSDYQKNGMTFIGSNLTVDVSDNTVTGSGAVSFIAQNGIQVSGGASGTVGPNNAISNLSYTPSSVIAAGVLVLTGNVNILHNTVTDVQAAIYLYQGNTSISSNVVTTNQTNVGTAYFYGIIAYDPPHALPEPFDEGVGGGQTQTRGMQVASGTLSMDVSDNTVTATGSSTDSIGLESDAGYIGNETVTLVMKNNYVSGWGIGVTVFQCESSCTGSSFDSATVQNNVIENNTVGLDSNITVDATKNWWGSPDGPGGTNNGIGTGGGTITTTPHAGALTESVTASTHEIGEQSTLQTNVTVDGLYGVQLRVSHDDTVLDFTSGQKHDVGGFFWDEFVEDFIAVTSPTGTRASGSMSAEFHPTPADLTDANIATWHYTCNAVGSSALSYDTTSGDFGTQLSDIDGFEIPSALLGDSVTCTAATGSLSGTIDLQGRKQNATSPKGWNGAVVTLTCVGGSGCDGYGPYVFYTPVSGAYSLTKTTAGTGVAAGTYNVNAERRAYLTATKAGLIVPQSGALTMTTPRLKGGDLNNDGMIDLSDLTAVAGVFGTSVTADTGPDINGDAAVNIFDLTLTGGNYNATPTWP